MNQRDSAGVEVAVATETTTRWRAILRLKIESSAIFRRAKNGIHVCVDLLSTACDTHTHTHTTEQICVSVLCFLAPQLICITICITSHAVCGVVGRIHAALDKIYNFFFYLFALVNSSLPLLPIRWNTVRNVRHKHTIFHMHVMFAINDCCRTIAVCDRHNANRGQEIELKLKIKTTTFDGDDDNANEIKKNRSAHRVTASSNQNVHFKCAGMTHRVEKQRHSAIFSPFN